MQAPAGCARKEDIKTTRPGFITDNTPPKLHEKLVMEAELCPLDDRRSAAEIWLKLAVVHFTTMTAYCHLLSMRGEPTRAICTKTMLFLFCPGSIIIQHILAILAFVGAYVVVQFINLKDSTPLQLPLKRALVILFGRIDRCSSQSALRNSDGRRSVIKTIGRLTVVLALTTQSIGSCIIFVRRHKHDAATLGDWRVLELAIAALLISLLTVVYLLWEPTLRLSPHETAQLSHHRHRTYLDAVLLYLRGMPAPTDSDACESIRARFRQDFIRIVLDAPTIIGIFCTQPWIARREMVRVLRSFLPGGLVGVLSIFGCDGCGIRAENKPMEAVCQAAFFVTTVSPSTMLVLTASANTLRKRKRIGWPQALLQVLGFILIGLLSWGLLALIFVLSYIMAAPSFTFISLVLDLIEQLELLAAWPTDLECPLLWSDPKANFLWHLM